MTLQDIEIFIAQVEPNADERTRITYTVIIAAEEVGRDEAALCAFTGLPMSEVAPRVMNLQTQCIWIGADLWGGGVNPFDPENDNAQMDLALIANVAIGHCDYDGDGNFRLTEAGTREVEERMKAGRA
jgi:hypothetical protein